MARDLFRFSVGHFSCASIRDGYGGDEFDTSVLLLSADRKHILVDTGVGRGHDPNWGLVLDRFPELGLAPAEIDLVLFSHADWDHIGGATDEKGTPLFPCAQYCLARTERDFWLSDSERVPRSVSLDEAFRQRGQNLPRLRIAQLGTSLAVVDCQTEIVPGISLIAAPGHTPGSVAISVHSGTDALLFIGDLVFKDPNAMEDPQWSWWAEFDPPQAVASRRRIFQQAILERAMVQASHLPFPGVGRLMRHEQGYRWAPV